VEVNQERAKDAFAGGTILATDVAEYLVKAGVPFREAHEKVGCTVGWCQEKNRDLDTLTLEEWQALIPEVGEDLPSLLTPAKAVEARNTEGGTGFDQVKKQIATGKELVSRLREEMELHLAK
jgi:argininosuccinate lyase